MKVAQWGNSLGFRIPSEIVNEMKIKPGDDFKVKRTGEHRLEIVRDRSQEEALEALRRMAVPLPPGFKFNRDEIYDRGFMKSDSTRK